MLPPSISPKTWRCLKHPKKVLPYLFIRFFKVNFLTVQVIYFSKLHFPFFSFNNKQNGLFWITLVISPRNKSVYVGGRAPSRAGPDFKISCHNCKRTFSQRDRQVRNTTLTDEKVSQERRGCGFVEGWSVFKRGHFFKKYCEMNSRNRHFLDILVYDVSNFWISPPHIFSI